MESNLKVVLLKSQDNPLEIIACAAKLCYSKVGIEEINENLDKESCEKFVNMLIRLGHESPLEHVSFTFGIEGVSRALTHQLVRHRLASYSQQSQRYVDENQFDFIVPIKIKEDEEALKEFQKGMEDIQKSYDKIKSILVKNWTKEFISEGIEEEKAKKDAVKMANEDARFVLPNACETKIVVTMNARELMHFFAHRCCNRAQWEIRNLAYEMLLLVRQACPIIFDKSGPRCVNGVCPEGVMSCKKQIEMKEKYLNKKESV